MQQNHLEDLCGVLVNHVTDHRDGSWQKRLKARRDGEPRLAETLAELRPQFIVVDLIEDDQAGDK